MLKQITTQQRTTNKYFSNNFMFFKGLPLFPTNIMEKKL